MSTLRNRVIVASLSAIGLTTIGIREGFKDTAYVPVPGDKITIGFGSTAHEDGTLIKPGEKVTKERAEIMLRNTMNLYEKAVKECAPVEMFQYEFDAFVSLSYNIGPSGFCKSSIPKKLLLHDYKGACETILRFNQFQGHVLKGLDNRRKMEYLQCLGN